MIVKPDYKIRCFYFLVGDSTSRSRVQLTAVAQKMSVTTARRFQMPGRITESKNVNVVF
jgi:hypothetical protein